MCKNIFHVKNGMNNINFQCTGSPFRKSYGVWLEIARNVFPVASMPVCSTLTNTSAHCDVSRQ